MRHEIGRLMELRLAPVCRSVEDALSPGCLTLRAGLKSRPTSAVTVFIWFVGPEGHVDSLYGHGSGHLF
jgi:hypothetical protein